MTVKVTDATFDSDVIKSDVPVLVDFWAEWCEPCKRMEPALEEVSTEFAGKAVVAKLNIDENPLITQQFNVMSIPTMMIFKGGQPVDALVGVMAKEKVSEKLQAAI